MIRFLARALHHPRRYFCGSRFPHPLESCRPRHPPSWNKPRRSTRSCSSSRKYRPVDQFL